MQFWAYCLLKVKNVKSEKYFQNSVLVFLSYKPQHEIIFFSRCTFLFTANDTVDPDQMLQNEASDLVLSSCQSH